MLFVNLKNDVFGVSNEIHSFYDSSCYDLTDMYQTLEYFENNKIHGNDINDLHLLKVGKEFGVDYVVSGYVYTVNIPFKYSPTTTDPLPIFTQNNNDLTTQLFFRVSKIDSLTKLVFRLNLSCQKREKHS